ncbi:Ig-like domain-containing protein [Stutzerimonas zhaodongensis]|nr:Ig-like domain-containing protein [Stutzerimonas zhaodongensis]
MTTELTTREVVFIDSRVPQLELLLAAVRPDVELVMLDGSRDGLAQIADYLVAHPGEQAVHIVSHGRAGGVELGNQWLDSDNIGAHADALARIGQSLAPDGDILFYGCNLAAGAVGAKFLDQLTQATGANVAASDDLTGSVRLGGDWQLESQAGSVDTLSAFNGLALLDYDATLGVASENFDDVGMVYQDQATALTVHDWTFYSSANSDFSVDQSFNIGGGGEDKSLVWNWNRSSINDSSFKSTDGTDFKLNSFVFGTLGGNATVTISGYRDNVPVVAGETLDTTATHIGPNISYSFNGTGPNGSYGTATFGSAYANVDEVRFSLSPGTGLEIDDILISPAAVNPTVEVSLSDYMLGIGETASVTFLFSEAVNGFSAEDLTIPNGTLSNLVSGNGGVTWTATLTPDADTNGAANVIAVDMASVFSAASSMPGVGTTTSDNYAIDTVAPTVHGVGSSAANGIYKAGDAVSVQVSLSEAVTVTGTPQLTLETGASDRVANYASGSGTNTLNFIYTVQAGDLSADLDYQSTTALALNGGTITDAAGNSGVLVLATPGTAGSLGANSAITIDGVAPAFAGGATVPASATYGTGQSLDFTVTYDEAVTVDTTGGTPCITLTLGTGGTVPADYVSGSGTNTLTFRYTVAAGDQDANGIELASAITLNGGTVRDTAGNDAALTGIPFGSTAGVLVDAAAPSVSSISLMGPAKTNATSVSYAVTFSKAVTGVDLSDFELASTGTASGTVTSVSGSGSSYTVTVGGITGDGTLRLALQSSGTGITDVSGNPIAAGFTSDQAYIIDNVAPAAPSVPDLSAISDSGISSSDNITHVTTPTFAGMAEAKTTVTLYDTDGAVLGTTTADSAGLWSIASSALGSGTHTLTAKATDEAGNTSAASAGLALTIDTTAPAVPGTADLAAGNDSGTSNADNVTNSTTPTFTGTAEANATVTLFDTDGTTVLGTTTADGSGSWSIISATLIEGSHTLATKVTDAAGNVGAASASLDVTVDTTAPTVIITSNVSTLKAGQTATITFTFSEDPGASFTWDGSAGDVTVSGGVLGAISGTGLTRTATFTPAAGTEAGATSITVAAGSYADAAGNFGGAGVTLALTADSLPPAAPSAPDLASVSDSGTSSVDNITRATAPTFTGTAEANSTVRLFDTDGATELGSTTADGAGNWSITSATLTEGTHTLAARATDAAGNTSLASSGLDLTIDTTAPTFASATVTGNRLVLTFAESTTLDAASLPAAGDFEVRVGDAPRAVTGVAVDVAAKTVTLTLASPVTSGQAATVAYTDHDDLNAIQDAAGNEAASFGAAAADNLTPPPPPHSPPAPPPVTTETVDGVVLERLTLTNPDGSISQTITIPVVEAGRVEVVGNNGLADIPLVSNSSGATLLGVQVPTGYGLQASGVVAPQNAGSALQQLIQQIEARTPAGASQDQLLDGVSGFVQGLAANGSLLVQAVTPTTSAGLPAPAVPLVISGVPASAELPVSALVIDSRSLPSGSILQLDNVDFAVLVGAVQITGGAGPQIVWGDDAAQHIVLGADDDVLHGGGGDDTVGSEGGNDLIYGEAGNDTLFGGAGADRLHGGSGSDTARYEGSRDDYIITQDYSVITVQSKADPGDVDTLINIETLAFADGDQTVVYASQLDWISGLYHQVLGRQVDLDGIQYWARQVDDGLDTGDVALRFLDSVEAGNALSSGDASVTLNALYEGLLGRAADAAGEAYWLERLDNGLSLHDLAVGFMGSIEMQSQNLGATEWSFLG